MTEPTATTPQTDPTRFTRLEDKILGSLATAVIGDALGAPTETRSIPQIRTLFGGPVTEFHKPLADSPYSKGRHAAQITDDSSQLLMLAEVFIRTGTAITPRDVADMILEWSTNTDYFPHFAGPTTRRAVAALKEGADPETIGAAGDEATTGASNGAAMRAGAAGLAHPGDVNGAVQAALITARPSHFTSVGVAGAAAVAGAVAAALVDDATVTDVVDAFLWAALEGERLGRELGREVPAPSVYERAKRAAEIAITERDQGRLVTRIAAEIGTGLPAAEAVPAALGFFVAAAGDPWLTVQAAANAGDDTDTVACMAGSIAGAFSGFAAVPRDKYAQVLEANPIDIADVAKRLYETVR
ncbi:ADP-ribosylglycohydrolase family protein [Microbacterium sp. MYb66]|uniref:ADP-ribosylglycohydrolase family protein n=1 Tax=Microbacterium sp. MYb66 TaxID=1848692 RepID=UPI000CFFC8BF|nr:ADP-ribosylglycohydrolase family protein [Microbacterium sp. MYb66]PRA81447.1 ADP-ribosylglycohydrolase [Microbacterium sp. MYb66]